MAVIALDVGGSSVKHGVVMEFGSQPVRVESTPINSRGTRREIIGTFSNIIERHRASYPDIHQVALGFPGPFDYEKGISYISGLDKYEVLYEHRIADQIRARLDDANMDIQFRNDAEAAIIGEGLYGAAQSYDRVIGITLGTGIGSAFLVDGNPVIEGGGIPENGWLFPKLYKGEQADDVFSTRGLLTRFSENDIMIQQLVDLDPQQPDVVSILNDFGSDLGMFLAPFARDFRANAILVLGGISSLFEHFSIPLNTRLAPIPAVPGTLGQSAALLGAADLFNQ